MPTTPQQSWPELAFDSWLFAGEAAMVIWLRSMRLMMGGPAAQREAQRMMTEKFTANLTLLPAMMQGGLGDTPEAMGARALAHYRRPVQANRKRLGRPGR